MTVVVGGEVGQLYLSAFEPWTTLLPQVVECEESKKLLLVLPRSMTDIFGNLE